MEKVAIIQPSELAEIIKSKSEKVLIVDARTFCEYNTCHIINAINFWSSKIRKKRLQQNSISVYDFLQQSCPISLQEINFEEVVVYDQSASFPQAVPQDTFLHVLLVKLTSAFNKVSLLKGGFLEFQSQYYEMCEDSSQKGFLLTSFSQPCLPVANNGPTKILPFLFLGSQHDANNKQLLLEHNITYELNVSTSCPKPDFLQDSHFLRIAVNDNFSAKLLPHFGEAFRFIEKVREVGGRVLVHCLAGISRSPTIVISYVMKYLHLHYDEAYRYVKTRRPTISPNINFVGQLLEFDLHLFGNKVFFRSSPGPICPDEHLDCSSTGLSPGNSPLSKSSSSSCLDSGTDPDLGFNFNRSLPSLRLTKSFDEVPCMISRHAHFTPSPDFDDFLIDLRVSEPVRNYVSNKLPSSPVPHPSSPECSFSFSFFKEESPNATVQVQNDAVKDSYAGKERKKSPVPEVTWNKSNVCKYEEYKKSRHKMVGSNDSFSGKSSFEAHSLQGSVDEGEEEIPSIENCQKELVSTVSESPSHKESDLKNDNSEGRSHYVSQPKAAPLSYPLAKKDGNNEESSGLPPKTIKHSARKMDIPHQLPRSYSSSETYLNTRTRLEKQAAANQNGNNARKSFSSDEVGRGFQSACPPPTPPSAGYNKESYTNPIELARCDSWSTSGLGSEISDWDSVQGDTQSMEDAQGPFDAVFAEVFPGESQPTISLRDPMRRYSEKKQRYEDKSEKNELKKLVSEEKRNVHDSSSCSSKRSCSVVGSEESMGTSPTPRPVSLPGVSGTYNIADQSVSVDMGVELDDNRDWNKGGVEIFNFSPCTKRGQILIEHPPVSPRTMGDDVKYIMTWYKIDSSPRSNELFTKTKCDKTSQVEVEEHRGRTKFTELSSLGRYADSCQEKREKLCKMASTRSPEWFTNDNGKTNSLDKSFISIKSKERNSKCTESTRGIDNVRKSVSDSSLKAEGYIQSSYSHNLAASSNKSSSEICFKTKTNPEALCRSKNIGIQGSNLSKYTTEYSNSKREENLDSPPGLSRSVQSTKVIVDEKMKVDENSSSLYYPEDREKDSLHDRWQWWDNEFKKKIRNIKKNVSLASWESLDHDSATEDDSDDKGIGSNLAGFNLARELVQSMEDLLEREICDIKKQASSLSTRLGLPRTSVPDPPSTSPSKSTENDIPAPLPQQEINSLLKKFKSPERLVEEVTTLPTEICKVTSCPLTPPFSKDQCNLTVNCPRDWTKNESAFRNPFVFSADSSLRAKSEPPPVIEENLYRAKSCPGIPQGKNIDEVKASQKEVGITLRFPRLFFSSRNGHSKRYSCSALDFLPITKPLFESCPDVSQLSPFKRGTRSGSSGSSGSNGSSTHSSFNRLLKVS